MLTMVDGQDAGSDRSRPDRSAVPAPVASPASHVRGRSSRLATIGAVSLLVAGLWFAVRRPAPRPAVAPSPELASAVPAPHPELLVSSLSALGQRLDVGLQLG